MSAGALRGLAKHLKLFEKFKKDPIEALKELESKTGVPMGKVNVDDIEILRSMTADEIQLLASINEKVRKSGKPFKLGGE